MSGLEVADRLNGLRNVALEAVASGETLSAVADRLCRDAEAVAPGVTCSILTVGSDGLIHPLAGPSLPDHYAEAIEGVRIGPVAGSCGTAAYRGEPVEVADIENDPLWADYKALVLPLGLNACWSSPIKARDGRVIGTFAFYYHEKRGPNELEQQLVETCTHICAIAIEHADAQDRIEHLAYRDSLTGLPNRSWFHERAAQRMATGELLNILYLDLDDFKGVNDSLGHNVGDLLLKAVAERLSALLGENGFVARLSGDEFGIVQNCNDCDQDGARLAEKVLMAFEAPFDIDGRVLSTGVSIGIARAPADGGDIQKLASRADLALSAAKRQSRMTYRFFDPRMEEHRQARRELTDDLRAAIANNQLSVAYQPIVSLASGALTGFEALLRWQHPARGAIPPDEFIPLAEETGIIGTLGIWVLAEACREAASWPTNIRISVNLSPLQLRKPGFAVDVIQVLARANLSPGRLKLELTETALFGEDKVTLETLAALKQVGIGIALDDFGTGYSSLSHLRLKPLDRIKVDMSFVSKIERDSGSAAIVRAILVLARDLGLKTTAEGVETQAQRDWLIEHGCEDGQGYLLGRPGSAEEARQRIYQTEDDLTRRIANK
ncbi:MAG: EAL domain-containing protein [Rhizobiaceae bacterium]